jgi:hypothetical protein
VFGTTRDILASEWIIVRGQQQFETLFCGRCQELLRNESYGHLAFIGPGKRLAGLS